MEVNVKLNLRPITVPNFIGVETPPRPREEGIGEGQKFAIAELDAGTLEALCVQFRADLFKKAGKTDPDHDSPRQGCPKCGAGL